MIIALDTGNKQFKTPNCSFNTGIQKSKIQPALANDILEYDGAYYTISSKRIEYNREKFRDERFFVLSLFAIAKEMLYKNPEISENKVHSITLLLGLPPKHYGSQYKDFEEFYLNRGIIQFKYKGKELSIQIDKTITFVQGYSAIVPYGQLLEEHNRIMVIDIGGYTADYINIKNKQVNITDSGTIEKGVIPFYDQVIEEINSSLGIILGEDDVDDIILRNSTLNLEPELFLQIRNIIDDVGENHVVDIIQKFREKGMDLRTSLAVFIGGGSVLLRPYIENVKKEKNSLGIIKFIFNINANAKGYELSYMALEREKKAKK